MTRDATHLDAHLDALPLIRRRLSNEIARRDAATRSDERMMRSVWVKQIEIELDKHIKMLAKMGYTEPTDDELLAELATP